MKKRMTIMLVAVGLLLGGVIGFNTFKGYMIQKYMASSPIPPATVSTDPGTNRTVARAYRRRNRIGAHPRKRCSPCSIVAGCRSSL